MATKWGVDGVVKLGANTIGEMQRFEIEETVSPIVDSAMGDTWETHIPASGIKSWSANCDVHWDEGDTNGQLAATLGASLTLNLYPEGSTTGDVYYTGTASVVRRGITVEKDGRTIEMGIEFRGNRELASATV